MRWGNFGSCELLLSALTLPGCIYVPPLWNIGDAISEINSIEPGTTTKAQRSKLALASALHRSADLIATWLLRER